MKTKLATLAVAVAAVFCAGPALADHHPTHGQAQLAFEIPGEPVRPDGLTQQQKPSATGQVYHYRNCWNYYRWYYNYYYGWQRYYVGTRCY